MRTVTNKILSAIFLIVASTGCTLFYYPPTPSPHIFTEEKQVNMKGSIGYFGASVSAATNPLKNKFVQVDVAKPINYVGWGKSRAYNTQISFGVFKKPNPSTYYAAQAGLGYCKFDYTDEMMWDESCRGEYMSVFLFPYMSTTEELSNIGLGCRVSVNRLEYSYHTKSYNIDNPIFFISYEPTIFYQRSISRRLYLDLTVSGHLKNHLSEDRIRLWPYYFRVGIGYKISWEKEQK